MPDELEVFDFGDVPPTQPWLTRYTQQGVSVEVRYRTDDRYDVRFTDGFATTYQARELAELNLTAEPPGSLGAAVPTTETPAPKRKRGRPPKVQPAVPPASENQTATPQAVSSDFAMRLPRILSLADGSLERLRIELLQHGGPEGRELSNWLTDHIDTEAVEDFDADESDQRDGELTDTTVKANRYQRLIGELTSRLRTLHDQVSGPDVADALSGHVDSLADAVDNAETEITDDSDPWDKSTPWTLVSDVRLIKIVDPPDAEESRLDLATNEAALAEAQKDIRELQAQLNDMRVKLAAVESDAVVSTRVVKDLREVRAALLEENAQLRVTSGEAAPVATVSAEVADAFGMCGLPNTVIVEHPNVTRVRNELLKRKATPADRIKAMALLDLPDWTRQAMDCTKDTDAEKLSLRLVKAAKETT